MVFKTLDDFNNHIEGFSQGRFTGQLLVPKSIEEFDLKMERLRFVFIESEGFVGCHLYTLVPLFHDKKSFRPHLLLKTLKDLQAESGVGQVVETNDIGNAKSAIFDINLLLRWARMAGHGISENNAARVTNLAARMDDIKTVMGRPGAVTREWSTPECQCLKYFMNCGCDEDLEPAETDIPAAESELDRQEWLDEYIRHAKGRLLEVTNDIKARLNSELETARNRMTGEIHEIMSGLHKAIDPAGHSALYPSTDPDDDSGHEEG
jgi:hypothetical protein